MTVNDALKVLNVIEKEVTELILKKAYKEAALKFHPDHNPAGCEMMKLINEAKETLFSQSFPLKNEIDDSEFYDYGSEINEALNKIIHLQNIKIEICGSWVWVSGDTKPHKDILNQADFKYSGKKIMWWFKPRSQKKRWRSSELSMDEIRYKYGSGKIKTKKLYSLPARA